MLDHRSNLPGRIVSGMSETTWIALCFRKIYHGHYLVRVAIGKGGFLDVLAGERVARRFVFNDVDLISFQFARQKQTCYSIKIT